MGKKVLILLLFILLVASCNSSHKVKINDIDSKLIFPKKPNEIKHNGKITYFTDWENNAIYCAEFELYKTPVLIKELAIKKRIALIEFDSPLKRKFLNTPKNIIGYDTLGSNVVAGIYHMKSSNSDTISISFIQITPQWRLSLEVGFSNLNQISSEKRNSLSNNFFSTDATNEIYRLLEANIHQLKNKYQIEE